MRQFLLTRMADKNEEDQNTRFSNVNANFVSVPLIEVVPDFDWNQNRLLELEKTDWLFFSSQYGVKAFFETVDHSCYQEQIRTIVKQLKLATVGQHTSQCLKIEGYEATFVPSQANLSTLIEEWQEHHEWDDDTGIWINGDQLAHRFDMTNHEFIDWTLYHNQAPKGYEERLKSIFETHLITDYFVSSPSIWHRFYEVVKNYPLNHIHYYVLGEKTAQAIRQDIPSADITFLKAFRSN